MDFVLPIITAIIPVIVQELIKFTRSRKISGSKILSDQTNQIEKDIEFTKITNPKLSKELIKISNEKIFHKNYGFYLSNHRIQSYLDFISTANISIVNLKDFHNQGYLLEDDNSKKVSLELTKKARFLNVVNWVLFTILIGLFGFFIYISTILPKIETWGTRLALLFITILAVAIGIYYFAIRILVNHIVPYYNAKRIINTKNDIPTLPPDDEAPPLSS